MKNFEELIKLLRVTRKTKGYSLRQVADMLQNKGYKYTYAGLNKLEKNMNESINPLILKGLSEIYNLDYKILLKLAGFDFLVSETEHIKKVNSKMLPLFGGASAGNGYLNLNDEIGEYQVPLEDYKDGRYIVKICGNSMEGLEKKIYDGSYALVDPSLCSSVFELKEKVCIFTYEDETYIKQLEVNKQGIVILKSFNLNYDDIIVMNLEELKCEGRVLKTYNEQSW